MENKKKWINGNIFNNNTPREYLENYSSFLLSLEKNFLRTINLLKGTYSLKLSKKFFSKETADHILNLFSESKFTLKQNEIHLLSYSPLLIISCLRYNFSKTLDYIIKHKKNINEFVTDIEIDSIEYTDSLIIEELICNKFTLTKDNYTLMYNSPTFLIASLECDFERTIDTLTIMKESDILKLESHIAKQLINTLFIEKEKKFEKLPIVLKKTIINYLNETRTYDIDYTIDLVTKGFIPLTCLPTEVINSDMEFWKLAGNYSFHTKFEECQPNASICNTEKQILTLLGSDYSNCSCIEDALRLMQSKGLRRERMSIFELLAIQVFAAKELHKEGIQKKIDISAFDFFNGYRGSCGPDYLNLYITFEDESIYHMIATLLHEIEHAIQDKNVLECKINKDFDIDLYSKDKILTMILGKDEYYYAKYSCISYEYDAEIKSHIKAAAILNLFTSNPDGSVNIEEVAKDLVDYSIQLNNEDNQYYQDASRDRGYTLDELFEREMFKLMLNNKNYFDSLVATFPIIHYEYIISKNYFFRKSIADLINDIDNCSSKKDIGIYYNLLKNRLDLKREPDDNIEENLQEIIQCLNDANYNNITRKILNKLARTQIDKDRSKYKSYVYKLNLNQKR